MRWEKISSSTTNEVYHLHHQDKQLLTLTLHPFSNTVRVECTEEKRVFLIRREGFFRNKTVFCNEYGIRIGELGNENEQNFIDLNNERFYYNIDNKPSGQLVLYKETKEEAFVVCGLNAADGRASLNLFNNKELSTHSCLLMALCWYMFLPVTKTNELEYSS